MNLRSNHQSTSINIINIGISQPLLTGLLISLTLKNSPVDTISPPQPVQAESLGQSTWRGAWIIRDTTTGTESRPVGSSGRSWNPQGSPKGVDGFEMISGTSTCGKLWFYPGKIKRVPAGMTVSWNKRSRDRWVSPRQRGFFCELYV